VAATLTDTGEKTYFSFGIEKVESTEEGDLFVFGKASDGSVDADMQIVSPSFAGPALYDWLQTGGNLRVQHNAQRDPAGIGVEVKTDDSGATWVKSLVVEPVAKRLVSKGALRAYSVGIARPVIERDITGKARGGVITGGQIVELSLVDRPANKSCGIQLVKSADDGSPEYVGKVFGSEDVLAKYAEPDAQKADMNAFAVPDMSISFTPDDLMKIMQHKIVEAHYDDLAVKALREQEMAILGKDHREFSEAERRHQASQGNSLPDGSYPIPDADALHRAAILARSGHGNAEAARRLIARRARELGVPNPLDSDNKNGDGVTDAVTPEVVKDDTAAVAAEAAPDLVKDPEAQKASKKPKKGKKLPPWLQQDSGDGNDNADDKTKGDGASCKMDHAHTEKCSTDPKTASGAKDAADMSPMPHPDALQESPMPAGRRTPDTKSIDPAAALLRFKSLGMDADLGRLHDLTCPAYDPQDVARYHPFADFSTVIDLDVWMRKAVDAACGPMDQAMEAARAWEAAQALKEASPGELNDYRAELHKAFRDANPGPTSYPSPGAMSPRRFCRPVITAGHAASSPGYDGPNSSPEVATSAPTAGHFDRPPLGAGHQSPSPSFMKSGWEYPSEPGVPTALPYAHVEKERLRQQLSMLHDHLSHQFPMACPMVAQDAHVQPDAPKVPSFEGKADEPEIIKSGELDAIITKGRKKMLKKLGKKVMAGKLSLDEARSKVGNRMSRKAEDQVSEMVAKGAVDVSAVQEALERVAASPQYAGKMTVLKSGSKLDPAAGSTETEQPATGPEVIKSAVAEAVAPLMSALAEQRELLAKAEAKIGEQEARWEAAADRADPLTSAWTGIAFNPVRKSARPEAVTSIAENAERTQQVKRQLEHTWRSSENPAEREAAWAELSKY
jgi:hypothetical protein